MDNVKSLETCVREFARVLAAMNRVDSAAGNEITAESIIRQYHVEKPRLLWKVGKDALPTLRKLHDAESRYLMEVPVKAFDCYWLMGHPVEVVEGAEIRLITIGGNRE